MATVYEVCAIVITILLGVIGLEFALTIRSARKLAEEARHTLADVNTKLPQLLENAEVVTQTVRDTSERVGGTFNQAAGGIERIKGDALRSVADLIEVLKEGLGLWHDIRQNNHHKRSVG